MCGERSGRENLLNLTNIFVSHKTCFSRTEDTILTGMFPRNNRSARVIIDNSFQDNFYKGEQKMGLGKYGVVKDLFSD